MSDRASNIAKRPTMHRKRTSERADEDSSDNGSRGDDSRTRQRDRTNMACVHCRHRKIKCDGQLTCATCLRLKRHCEYERVTELQNMQSRDRKRRNKELKHARMASLSIFTSPSVMADLSQKPFAIPSLPPTQYTVASLTSSSDRSTATSDRTLQRRRRGISMTASTPALKYSDYSPMQHNVTPPGVLSLSQPPTPSIRQAHQYYQSLASPSLASQSPHSQIYALSSGLVSSYSPAVHHQAEQSMFGPATVLSPSVSRTGMSEADYGIAYSHMSNASALAPSSTHIGSDGTLAIQPQYEFPGALNPTQTSLWSDMPFTADMRRRSSIHLPVEQSDAVIHDGADTNVMHKDKRSSSVNADLRLTAHNPAQPDMSTGIAAWNAHVQSHHPEHYLSWSGPNTIDVNGYMPPGTPVARSNSDGLLSLGPLSPPNANSTNSAAQRGPDGTSSASHSSVSSNNGDALHFTSVRAVDDFFAQNFSSPIDGSMTFSLGPLNAPSSAHIKQHGWAAFQNDDGSLLSPVSDLNNSFNNFGVFGPPATPLANAATSIDYTRQPQFSHQQSPQQHRPTSQHYDTGSLSTAFGQP